MQVKGPPALLLMKIILIVSAIVVGILPMGFLSSSGSALSETNFHSYIIEAENAVGEWGTGFIRSLDIKGAYTDASEELPGAVSQVGFTITVPGYYFIGCRVFTPHDIGWPGKMVSVFLTDPKRKLIRNQFENTTIGTSPEPQGGFTMHILGLWNLPKGNIKLTFRGHATRFLAVDYFYLTPLITAGDVLSVILPMTGYKPRGDWHILEKGAQTERPGVSAWTVFHLPTAGEYNIYANLWHQGGCRHKINFDLQQPGKEDSVKVILEEDESTWKAVRLGSFSLKEGAVTIRFTNDSSNPSGCLVKVEDILFLPDDSMVLTEAPNLPRREGMWVDGLLYDWTETTFSANDPLGDTARTTDFKTLKATIEDDYLWVAVEFSALSFFLGWDTCGELGIDFDGDRGLDFWVHLPIEGRGGQYKDLTEDVPFDDIPSQPLEEAEGGTWQVIELKIPLSAIGNRTEFHIYYTMWDRELLIDKIGPLHVRK